MTHSKLLLGLSFATLLLLGCAGGGSSGTGKAMILSGTLRSADATPLAGVEVSIEGTNLSDVTDQNGEFAIIASAEFENFTLNFESAEISESLTIEAIPEDTGFVSIEVEYQPEGEGIAVDSIDFEEAPPPDFEFDGSDNENGDPDSGGSDDAPSGDSDEILPSDDPSTGEDPPADPVDPTEETPADDPTDEQIPDGSETPTSDEEVSPDEGGGSDPSEDPGDSSGDPL